MNPVGALILMEFPAQIVALVIFSCGGEVLIIVAVTATRLLSQSVAGSNTLTKKSVVVFIVGVVKAGPVNKTVVLLASAYQRYTCVPMAPPVAFRVKVPLLQRLPPVAVGEEGGVQANTVKACVEI